MKSIQTIYQGKCFWRKRQIRRAACCRKGRLGHGAAAILAIEAAVLLPRGLHARGVSFALLRQEQSCQVEWIIPEENSREAAVDIYGLSFIPSTWEIQIYHRQEILSSESQIPD